MSRRHIEIVSLTQRFVEVAVDDMNLVILQRRVLLAPGPSGLRQDHDAAAHRGVEQPTAGTVLFDGADVTNVAANSAT